MEGFSSNNQATENNSSKEDLILKIAQTMVDGSNTHDKRKLARSKIITAIKEGKEDLSQEVLHLLNWTIFLCPEKTRPLDDEEFKGIKEEKKSAETDAQDKKRICCCWDFINILFHLKQKNRQEVPTELFENMIYVLNEAHEIETQHLSLTIFNKLANECCTKEISQKLSKRLAVLLDNYFKGKKKYQENNVPLQRSVEYLPQLEKLLTEIKKFATDIELQHDLSLSARLREVAINHLLSSIRESKVCQILRDGFDLIKQDFSEKVQTYDDFITYQSRSTSWATVYELTALAEEYGLSVVVSEIDKEPYIINNNPNNLQLELKLSNKIYWSFNTNTVTNSSCLYNSIVQALYNHINPKLVLIDQNQIQWYLDYEVEYKAQESSIINLSLQIIDRIVSRDEPVLLQQLTQALEKALESGDSKICSKALLTLEKLSKSTIIKLALPTITKILWFCVLHWKKETRKSAMGIIAVTYQQLTAEQGVSKQFIEVIKYYSYQTQTLPLEIIGFLLQLIRDFPTNPVSCCMAVEAIGWTVSHFKRSPNEVLWMIESLSSEENKALRDSLSFVLSRMDPCEWQSFNNPSQVVELCRKTLFNHEIEPSVKYNALLAIRNAILGEVNLSNEIITGVLELKTPEFLDTIFEMFYELESREPERAYTKMQDIILQIFKRESPSKQELSLASLFLVRVSSSTENLTPETILQIIEEIFSKYGDDLRLVADALVALRAVTKKDGTIGLKTLTFLTTVLNKIKSYEVLFTTNNFQSQTVYNAIKCIRYAVPKFLEDDHRLQLLRVLQSYCEFLPQRLNKIDDTNDLEIQNLDLVNKAMLKLLKALAKSGWKLPKSVDIYVETLIESSNSSETLKRIFPFALKIKVYSIQNTSEISTTYGKIIQLLRLSTSKSFIIPKKLLDTFISLLDFRSLDEKQYEALISIIQNEVELDIAPSSKSIDSLFFQLECKQTKIEQKQQLLELAKLMILRNIPLTEKSLEILIKLLKKDANIEKIIDILVRAVEYVPIATKKILSALEGLVVNRLETARACSGLREILRNTTAAFYLSSETIKYLLEVVKQAHKDSEKMICDIIDVMGYFIKNTGDDQKSLIPEIISTLKLLIGQEDPQIDGHVSFVFRSSSEVKFPLDNAVLESLQTLLFQRSESWTRANIAATIALQIHHSNKEVSISSNFLANLEELMGTEKNIEVQQGLWLLFLQISTKGHKLSIGFLTSCGELLINKTTPINSINFIMEILEHSAIHYPGQVASILLNLLTNNDSSVEDRACEILIKLCEDHQNLFLLEANQTSALKNQLQLISSKNHEREYCFLSLAAWWLSIREKDGILGEEAIRVMADHCKTAESSKVYLQKTCFITAILEYFKLTDKISIQKYILDILYSQIEDLTSETEKYLLLGLTPFLGHDNPEIYHKLCLIYAAAKDQLLPEALKDTDAAKIVQRLKKYISDVSTSSLLLQILTKLVRYTSKVCPLFLKPLLELLPIEKNIENGLREQVGILILMVLLNDSSLITKIGQQLVDTLQKNIEQTEEISPTELWILARISQINSQFVPEDILLLIQSLLTEFDGYWEVHWSVSHYTRAIESLDDRLAKLKENGSSTDTEKQYLLITKGYVLCHQGLLKQGIEYFDDASNLSKISNNDLASALAHKANALSLLGSLDEAHELFRKAINMQKNYSWALEKMTNTLLLMGKYELEQFDNRQLSLESEGFEYDNARKLNNFCNFLINEGISKTDAAAQVSEILKSLQDVNPGILSYYLFVLANLDFYDLEIIKDCEVEDWPKYWLSYSLIMGIQDGDRDEVSLDEYHEQLLKWEEYEKLSKFDLRRCEFLMAIAKIQRHLSLTLPEVNELIIISKIQYSLLMDLLIGDTRKSFKELKDSLYRARWKNLLNDNSLSEQEIDELTKQMDSENCVWSLEDTDYFLLKLSGKRILKQELMSFLVFLQKYAVPFYEIRHTMETVQIFENTSGFLTYQRELETSIMSSEIEAINNLTKREMCSTLEGIYDLLQKSPENSLDSVEKPSVNSQSPVPAFWDFNSLYALILNVKEKLQKESVSTILINSLSSALSLLLYYRLQPSEQSLEEKTILQFLSERSLKEWTLGLHELVCKKNFNTVESKTWKQLEKEMITLPLNRRHTCVKDLLESRKLSKSYNCVLQMRNQDCPLYPQAKNISQWTKSDVIKWSGSFIKNRECKNPLLLLAIITRAVELAWGYFPRITLILVVLCLLEKTPEQGRLAQVLTGEGKTTAIAMFAAIQALKGAKVDVVTTSPVLAERDAENNKEFYELLSLTVGHNKTSESYADGPKLCYLKDVVYGSNEEFEADILRTDYRLFDTRSKRGYGIVVVDEVDSMLIDQSGDSTRLVGQMPGMDHLLPLQALIWQMVDGVRNSIIKIKDKDFEFDPSFEGSQDIFKAVLHTLPEQTKIQYNITSLEKIELLLSEIQASCGAESNELRKEFARILKNPEFDETLSESVQEALSEIQDRSTITVEHEVVNLHVKEFFTSLPGKLKILGDQINIRFYIFQIQDENISPHPDFFDEDDDEEEGDVTRGSATRINPVGLYFVEKDGTFNILKLIDNVVQKVKDLVQPTIRNSAEIKIDLEKGEDNLSQDSKIEIPSHLIEYAQDSLEIWIESAFEAHMYEENRHYLIKEDDHRVRRISPIDYNNTGVVQSRMQWSDGLHQFLQMKHKLKLAPEQLVTNFMSNMTFFKKYEHIYGLTGTLGSESEQNLLGKIYNLDMVQVPPYKPKQLLRLVDVMANSHEQWFSTIINSCMAESSKGRAVLIICETIQEALIISQELQRKVTLFKEGIKSIKLYTRDDTTERDTVNSNLTPGEIVVATNLAGRGTDFKLHQAVINSGGLHICVTFLPENLRVEEQAIGRTSRQGQPGTAQLIIKKDDAISRLAAKTGDYKVVGSIEDLFLWRDEVEAKSLINLENNQVKKLTLEENLFKDFCRLLSEVRNSYPDKKKARPILLAIEERWGLFLKKHLRDDKAVSPSKQKEIYANFANFIENIKVEHKNGSVIKNPYYYILLGSDDLDLGNNNQAISYYEKAIALDQVFSANAFYNRAYAKVKLEKDKSECIRDLQMAQFIILSYLQPFWVATSTCISTIGPDTKEIEIRDKSKLEKEPGDDLTKQLSDKVDLLILYEKCIRDAIENINKFDEIEGRMWAIETYFKDGKPIPKDEVMDVYGGGIVGFYKITEKPKSWICIIAVFIIAAAQVLGGVLLTPFCANFGLGLIGEGVGDIIFGIQAIKDGDFSWESYLKHKAISLAISIGTAGICSAAGKAASIIGKQVAKHATSSIVKLGTKIVAWGKNVVNSVKKVATSIKGSLNKGVNLIKNMKVVVATKNLVKRAYSFIKRVGQKAWSKVKIACGRSSNSKAIDQVVRKGIIPGYVKEGWKLGAKKALLSLSKGLAQMGLNYLIEEKALNEMVKIIAKAIKERIRGEIMKGVAAKKEIIVGILILAKNRDECVNKIKRAGTDIIYPNQQNSLLDDVNEVSVCVVRNLLTNPEISSSLRSKNLKTAALIAKVVSWCTTIVDSSIIIAKIIKLVDNFFSKLSGKLGQIKALYEADKYQSKGATPNISQLEIQLTDLWTDDLGDQMSQLIYQEFLKPGANLTVKKLVDKCFQKTEKKLNTKLSSFKERVAAEKAAKVDINTRMKKTIKAKVRDIQNLEKGISDTERDGLGCISHFRAIQDISGKSIDLYVQGKNGQIKHRRSYNSRQQDKKDRLALAYIPPSKECPIGHWKLLESDSKGQLRVSSRIDSSKIGPNDCLFAIAAHCTYGDHEAESIMQIRKQIGDHQRNNAESYLRNSNYTNLLKRIATNPNSHTNYQGAGKPKGKANDGPAKARTTKTTEEDENAFHMPQLSDLLGRKTRVQKLPYKPILDKNKIPNRKKFGKHTRSYYKEHGGNAQKGAVKAGIGISQNEIVHCIHAFQLVGPASDHPSNLRSGGHGTNTLHMVAEARFKENTSIEVGGEIHYLEDHPAIVTKTVRIYRDIQTKTVIFRESLNGQIHKIPRKYLQTYIEHVNKKIEEGQKKVEEAKKSQNSSLNK